jgi:hypothetical protein
MNDTEMNLLEDSILIISPEVQKKKKEKKKGKKKNSYIP